MPSNVALTVAPITSEELMITAAVASKIRQATQTIVDRGAYTSPDGIDISIAALQSYARAHQHTYDAMQSIDVLAGRYRQTQLYVYNQTALTIARERVRQGYRVAMLHFVNPPYQYASSVARPSQEDSLMWASSLAYCMHDVVWPSTAPFYDDTIVVTPQVPIFRDHGGDLLTAPWRASMIHAMAVDAHAVRQRMPEREAEIPHIMVHRAQRILQAGAMTRANVLVLGAWGCGRAGHDAAVMAATWNVAIAQSKVQTYGIIDFAIADIQPNRPTFNHFYQRLHTQQISLT
ncbi:MAG: TIGR02452 family protein [Roseiflexaceae bacterium]